jgi:hypothetical protein
LILKDEEVKQQIAEKKKIIDRYNALMQAESKRLIANLEKELREQRQRLEVYFSPYITRDITLLKDHVSIIS